MKTAAFSPMSLRPASLFFDVVAKEQLEDGRVRARAVMVSEDLDDQNEVVDYDGARRAMANWRGNVRLGHEARGRGEPVGHALDVIFDDENREISVEFFVSEGAPNVQKMILDGTLGGVTVGGYPIKDKAGRPIGRKSVVVDKSLLQKYPRIPPEKVGEKINVLTDWRMTELSIWDAQANPRALIEIVKQSGGDMVANELTEEGDHEMKKNEKIVAKQEPAEDVSTAPADDAPEKPETEPTEVDSSSEAIRLIDEITNNLQALAKIAVDDIGDEGTFKLRELVDLIEGVDFLRYDAAAKMAHEKTEEAMSNTMKQSDASGGAAADAVVKMANEEEKSGDMVSKARAAIQKAADTLAAVAKELGGDAEEKPAEGEGEADTAKQSGGGETITKSQFEALNSKVDRLLATAIPGGPSKSAVASKTVTTGAGESTDGVVAKSIAEKVGKLPDGLTPADAREFILKKLNA